MSRIRGIGTAQHARRRAIRPLSLDPLTIFGADLELWLRSDRLVGLSGSDVLTWGDLSGKVHNFSSVVGNRPTFDLSDANWSGKPSLGFDSTPLWLDSDDAASVWKFLHDGTGGGYLEVYRFNATDSATLAATATTPADVGLRLRAPQAGNQRLGIANGTGFFTINDGTPASVIDTNYYGYYAYEEGRPVNEWIQAVLSDTAIGDSSGAGPSVADPSSTLRIGASPSSTVGFRGDVLEAIAFSVYPTDEQFIDLKAYLSARYGLS